MLVGAAEYRTGGSLRPLPAVRHNVKDLYLALTDRDLGFLSPTNCRQLLGPATPRAVSEALIAAAERAEDTLLFYFAGHGIRSTATGELFLSLHDTDPANLPFTAVRYADLRAILTDRAAYPARRRIVILDCCFAGTAITATMSNDDLDGAVVTEGACVLTATSDVDFAYAPPGERNTAFTAALLETLREGLAGGEPTLSLDVIYRNVDRLMRSRTKHPPLRSWDVPRAPRWLVTDTIGSLPLVRNAAHESTPRPPIDTILGLDVGDGDTVVTRLAVGRPEPMAEIELDAGETCIPTAVADGIGGVLIGSSAITEASAGVLRTRLKSALAAGDRNTAEDIARFARGIRARVARRTTLEPERTQVVVGHPVRWSTGSAELAAYAEALTDGLGMTGLQLVPESRAVLLALRHWGSVQDDDLRRRLIVIDVGSFTTDITIVEDLEAVDVPDPGAPALGASLIDAALLRRLVERDTSGLDFAAHFAARPQDRERLRLAVRRAKETWFTVAVDRTSDRHTTRVNPPDQLDDGIELRGWAITGDDIAAAVGGPLPELDGRSWRDRFAEDLRHALGSLHQPPDRICLTGGGSQMPFLAEVIVDETGLTPLRPWSPHLAVAQGLAISGDARVRSAQFLRAVDGLTNKLRDLVSSQIPGYADAFADCLTSGLTERFVLPEFLAWQQATTGTLSEISGRVDRAVAEWIASEEGAAALGRALHAWQQELQRSVAELTAPVCGQFGIDQDALNLPLVYLPEHLAGHAADRDQAFRGPLVAPAITAITSAASLGVLIAGFAMPAPAGVVVAIGGGPVSLGSFVLVFGLIGVVTSLHPDFREYVGDQVLERTIPPAVRRRLRPERVERKIRRSAPDFDARARAAIVAQVTAEPSRERLTQMVMHGDPTIPGLGLMPALRARAEAVTALLD